MESLETGASAALLRTFNAGGSWFMRRALGGERSTLAACIGAMRTGADNKTFSIPDLPLPQAWTADVTGFAFVDLTTAGKPRRYSQSRIFIYRNASTDWHYHPTDETLMTQVVGARRVSLFRLSPKTWATYADAIEGNFHHLKHLKCYFPDPPTITKYCCVLEPGDALYIPPFWWHGVDTADTGVGVTLARCFSTPLRRLGDWSDPITKRMLRRLLSTDRAMFCRMATLIALGAAQRRAAGECWYADVPLPAHLYKPSGLNHAKCYLVRLRGRVNCAVLPAPEETLLYYVGKMQLRVESGILTAARFRVVLALIGSNGILR